jgi:hypothetical protein
MPPTYSPEYLAEIAKAVGLSADDLAPFISKLENAALWFDLNNKSLRRMTPSDLRRRLDSISGHAQNLLKRLGIDNSENPFDEIIDPTILAVLANPNGPSEGEMLQAADRISRLREIISFAQAASDLDKWTTAAVNKSIILVSFLLSESFPLVPERCPDQAPPSFENGTEEPIR